MVQAGTPVGRGQSVAPPTSDWRGQTFAARAQWRRLRALLRLGAEAHGFRGALWTRQRVAWLIEWEFAIVYSPRHVSRLLKEMGWSSQRPLRRARQRNEQKIARWRSQRWPALKAKPNAWARAFSL
jgi:transposase